MKKISYLAIVALTAASLSTVTNSALAKSKPAPAPKAAPAPAPKAAPAPAPKPPAQVVVAAPAPAPKIVMPKLTPAPAPAPKPAPLPAHVQELKSPVVAKASSTSSSNFTYSAPVAQAKVATPAPSYKVPSSSTANNAVANLASSMKGLTADQAERKLNDAKANPVLNPNLSTKTGTTIIKESSPTTKEYPLPSIFTNNGTKTTTTNDGKKIITTTETSTTETKRTTLATVIDRVVTTNSSLSSLNGKASQKSIIDVANKLGTLQTTAQNSANAKMKFDSTALVNDKAYKADLNKRIDEAQKTGNTVFLLQSFASPEGSAKHNQELSEKRAKEILARDISILIKDGWKCTASCGTGKDGKDKDGNITYEKNGKIISYISVGMGEVLPGDPVLGKQYDKAVKACSSGSASKCEAALSPMRTTLTTAINPKDLINKTSSGTSKDASTDNTVITTSTVETPILPPPVDPTKETPSEIEIPGVSSRVTPGVTRVGPGVGSTSSTSVTAAGSSTGTTTAVVPTSGSSTSVAPRTSSGTGSASTSSPASTSGSGVTAPRSGSASTSGPVSTPGSGVTATTSGPASTPGSGVTAPTPGSTLTPSPSSNNAPKPPFKIS